MNLLQSILQIFIGGNKSERDIKNIRPILDAIKSFEQEYEAKTLDELRAVSQALRAEIQSAISPLQQKIDAITQELADNQTLSFANREDMYDQIDGLKKDIDAAIAKKLDEILPQAFALVKETARRFANKEILEVTATEFDKNLATHSDFVSIEGNKALWKNTWRAGGNMIQWDMVHYDVQLIGGTILHQGKIAEMATGEGKTLVATLPVFLNALPGMGVHVVTVNDYLARRDSEWMGPLYQFHGLSVDCIDRHEPHSEARRNAYKADITFGTNNEFGFDYLRDNMSSTPDELVQRPHNFAIVDEVDSVLIDDARTPLIISGPISKKSNSDELFVEYRPKIEKIYNAQKALVTRLLVDAKNQINSEDKKVAEEGAKFLLRAHKALPKTKALIKLLSEQGMKTLLTKTENFYMAENNKHMHLVTDDLFFVIDEKNNSIELTEKGIDFLSSDMEDKSFFILPDIGSEIAEIEKSNLSDSEKIARKDQLVLDYSIKSDRVHAIQQLLKAYTLFELDVEYVVMDNKVKIVDEQTGRIMEGRRYSDGLHQAIEAKERVKVEAATQTHATITLQNYFRMYKKLSGMTGTAETEAKEFWDIYKLEVVVAPTNKPIARIDKDDLVYKTRREKYNAVIEHVQELVQAGRPVLVGTTSVEISELLSKMLKMRNIKHNVLNAKQHQKEAEIVAEAGQAGTVTIATNMAGRGTDIKLSQAVKDAGGLAIVGTERHESRRVDRQLRGRAGRQGDPGSSQFFVSLEDNLMRMFGSDRIARIMDRLGLEEGEVIQHSMISKSIERAQRKVEENHFGVRKRLLEYDDVMNSQREVIYSKRRHALFGERIGVDFSNMMYDLCAGIISQTHGQVEYEDFRMELLRVLSLESSITEKEFMQLSTDDLTEKLYSELLQIYDRRAQTIAQQAFPKIKEVFENEGAKYKNIVVPISDGKGVFSVLTNLERATQTEGKEVVRSFLKALILMRIDDAWKEHLRELDDLKQSVQNASYEQKDPLLIYKFESFNLFQSMLEQVNKEVVSSVLKAQIPQMARAEEGHERRNSDMQRMQMHRNNPFAGNSTDTREVQRKAPVRIENKVGRNDPCPCGSGKKFKSCHGKVGNVE
ncbi:MAG: preprotein translocase subunit SecA [Bacteroidales bacterium]|jgi:preprotein translocase subunit SecA|nr:preprotein translocase subunit SecA [Bacteroidales bacterium]